MKISDIKDVLADAGLPVTYLQWPEHGVPELPYLVWYLPNSRNIAADNKVYKRREALNVELYANPRDFATEAALEAVLDEAGLVWEKTADFIGSENMSQTLYETEILIEPETAASEDS
jgi:hypothetical protein